MFRPAETFETERLVLRLPRYDDAEAIFEAYARDPEVTRYLSWKTHESIEVTREFLRDTLVALPEGKALVWMICRREDGRLIGSISLDIAEEGAELGYVLAQHAWGNGYATEAARVAIEHAFSIPGVRRVFARCNADNPASIRVLEKCGMQREGGPQRGTGFPNLAAGRQDSCVYAIANVP